MGIIMPGEQCVFEADTERTVLWPLAAHSSHVLTEIRHPLLCSMDECTKTTLNNNMDSTTTSPSSILPWRDCQQRLPPSTSRTKTSTELTVSTPESHQDSAIGDESSWVSWLRSPTHQSPYEDPQACKVPTAHAEFDYAMHHKETDYAHHKHYLHQHHYREDDIGADESDVLSELRPSQLSASRYIQEKLRQSRLRELQTRNLGDHVTNRTDSIRTNSEPTEDSTCISSGPHHQHHFVHHPHHHHHHHQHHHHHHHHQTHSNNRMSRLEKPRELSELTENELIKLSLNTPGSEPPLNSSCPRGPSDEKRCLTESYIPDRVFKSDFEPVQSVELQDAWQELRYRVMDWLDGVVEAVNMEQDVNPESESTKPHEQC